MPKGRRASALRQRERRFACGN